MQSNKLDKYKTINPETNEFFKKGDKRKDGKIFHMYKSIRSKRTGLYLLAFYSPEYYQKQLSGFNLMRKKIKESHYPKRLNPKTNKIYVLGDREGDLYFIKYDEDDEDTKLRRETWRDFEGLKIQKIRHKLVQIRTKKNYAKHKKYSIVNKADKAPTDLDFEYLYEIFPKNNICPILKNKMSFGTDYPISQSPSLDRIDNSIGYVKGNVFWMSTKANRLKGDLTISDIDMLLNFYTPLINNGYKHEINKSKQSKEVVKYIKTSLLPKIIKRHKHLNFKEKSNIDLDYLFNLLPKDMKCPVSGIEMNFGGMKIDTPSLDRINNNLGYIKGNVIFIAEYINNLKRDNSIESLKLFKRLIKNKKL